MSYTTNIEIKNGKWEINGRTLAEHKGDRKVIDSLLMSTFKIKQIQTPVNQNDFNLRQGAKFYESLGEIISTVNRPALKAQNYTFNNHHSDYKFQMPEFILEHLDISKISFVRKLGKE
jgi:hypothetical protein